MLGTDAVYISHEKSSRFAARAGHFNLDGLACLHVKCRES